MEILHNDVIDALLERRSIRGYSAEALTEDQVHTLVQTGLWAPSGRNHQTTRLAVVQDRALIAELQMQLTAGVENPSPWLVDFSYGAPCVIFAFDVADNRWSGINAALAVENMHVAAHSLGLGSVIIGIIREFMLSDEGRAFQRRLGIPDEYTFVLALAVGHPTDTGKIMPRKNQAIYVKED